jgi:DNA-binding PadR family transcriptional regulator
MTDSQRPGDFLPLGTQTFQVLLALGEETLHGYGIIQAFEAMTEGRETLLPGSLYGTLGRMVDSGILAEAEAPGDESSGGPKRRYYSVTELGRAVARAEAERMDRLVEAARLRKWAPEGAR